MKSDVAFASGLAAGEKGVSDPFTDPDLFQLMRSSDVDNATKVVVLTAWVEGNKLGKAKAANKSTQ